MIEQVKPYTADGSKKEQVREMFNKISQNMMLLIRYCLLEFIIIAVKSAVIS